jgi:hypothetical protein
MTTQDTDNPDTIIAITKRIKAHSLVRHMKGAPHGRRLLVIFDGTINPPTRQEQDPVVGHMVDILERVSGGRGLTDEEEAMVAEHQQRAA